MAFCFFFQAEDGIRDHCVTGVQTCALPILLQRLRVEPVFTAHPTEATRRTLLEKEQVIGRLLVERLDPSRTPDEERSEERRVGKECRSRWSAEHQRKKRKTRTEQR